MSVACFPENSPPTETCFCNSGRSNVVDPARKYRAMMETSITIEPIIVYKKNLTVA